MTNRSEKKLNADIDAYAKAAGRSAAGMAGAQGREAVSAARKVKSQLYSYGKQAAEVAPDASRSGAAGTTSAAHPTGFVEGAAATDTLINNMRVTTTVAKTETVDLVMTDTGEIKQVMLRRPVDGQLAVIDWINFTVLEDTWFKTAREVMIDDDQIITEASRQLEKIFGFGITVHRQRGMNFYRDSWMLGDDFGFVCFGAQRGTMLITLNGHGCANAVEGWERRLYDFLTKTAIRPVISRIDIAHDDLEGSYLSVEWADRQWEIGGFTASSGGQSPEIEHIGNWKRPNGKGRTLTVGRRRSGKFCRFYEKGKKEGDKSSLWLRVEVEFKSGDRVIPFDVLLDPSSYFCAAYPCFSEFAQVDTPARIEVKRKTAEIVIDASIETTRHQFGKYIRVFRDLFGDKEALDLICHPDKNAWPKRLKPLTDTSQTSPTPIHRQEKPEVPSWIDFITAVPSFGLNGENGFHRAVYQ